MTKPRKPGHGGTHEATKGVKPAVHIGRVKENLLGTPGARINRRAADRLRSGYLWVYASDIESIELPQTGEPPALLQVGDGRGLLLGTALYSPSSQIALRMVARESIYEASWL